MVGGPHDPPARAHSHPLSLPDRLIPHERGTRGGGRPCPRRRGRHQRLRWGEGRGDGHPPRWHPRHGGDVRRQRVRRRHGRRSSTTATTRRGAGTRRARSQSAGNHEYHTSGATRLLRLLRRGRGRRRDRAGTATTWARWHIVVLNSNCSDVGCGPNSAQVKWLRADLAAHAGDHVIAYWHHPRFSSGEHGNDDTVQPFWDALYAAGADIVLNGHDHDYERFAPQTPSGQADAAARDPRVRGGHRRARASSARFDREEQPGVRGGVRRAQADAPRELVRLEVRADRRGVVHGQRDGHAARLANEGVQGRLRHVGGPTPPGGEPCRLPPPLHGRRCRAWPRPPHVHQVQALGRPRHRGPGRAAGCG